MSSLASSPEPFSTSLTMPPPEVPSTSSSASFAWASASFSCMALACFIREFRSFTSILVGLGVVVRRRGGRRLRRGKGAHPDDLGAREGFHHLAHEGILLDLGADLALLALLPLP